MAWQDWLEAAGSVWEWFDDNETAQDITGALLQKMLYDAPELDYDKLIEMAIKQAEIDSPDQFTPTMNSVWDVDPETGKRTQNLAYKPEFQALLDMLVQRAGGPKTTYRAPQGMTEGLLGSRMNHLLTQSGQDTVDHQRFQFPEQIYADFGDAFTPPPPANNAPTPTNTDDDDETPAPVVAPAGGEYGGSDQIGSSNGSPNYAGPVGSEGWLNYDWLQNGFPTGSPYGQGGSARPDSPFDWLPNDLQPLQPGTEEGIEWAERAGLIGRGVGSAVGAVTGVPGLGTAGDWIGDWLGENYFNNHVFQSPANLPPSDLIRILDEISNPWGDLPNSPSGPGGGTYGGGARGEVGTWAGATRLDRS